MTGPQTRRARVVAVAVALVLVLREVGFEREVPMRFVSQEQTQTVHLGDVVPGIADRLP